MKTIEAVQALREQREGLIVEEIHFLEETTIQIETADLKKVLCYLKQSGFAVLMDFTGVDYLTPTKHTCVIYWLHNPENYERLRVVVVVGRGQSLPTVIDLWEGAAWYERELYDLFGITFDGHAGLKRILMPDDWQGHPLLKDYALTEESVEFKNNVKPKVPSEIITYAKNKI